MKKLLGIVIVTVLLLPIVNNLQNKVETNQNYAKADKSYMMRAVDPGGGG